VELSDYFRDPDRDPLTYTVTTSNDDIATASVSGSTLDINAWAAGTATVTVTAADPDGGTAEQSIEIIVTDDYDSGFADDFDDRSSLADWTLTDGTSATVRNSILRLTTDEGDGSAFRSLEAPLVRWDISVDMGRAEGDAVSYIDLLTPDETYPAYSIIVGSGFTVDDDPVNWLLLLYDADEEDWFVLGAGLSSEIDDRVGQLNEIYTIFDGDLLEIFLVTDDAFVELVAGSLSAELPTAIEAVALGVLSLEEGDSLTDRTALFDWVGVFGAADAEAKSHSGHSSARSLSSYMSITSRTLTYRFDHRRRPR